MNCEEEEWSDVSDHEESAPVPSCAASKRPVMPTFTGFGAGNAGAHNRVTAPMPAPASDELAGFGAPQSAPPTAAPVTVEAVAEPKADSKLSSMRGSKPVQSSSDDDVEPVAGTVAKEEEEEQQEKKEKPKLSMRGRAPVQSSSDDDDEEAATPATTVSTTKVEAPKPEKKEVAKEKAAPLSQDEIAKLSDDDSIWRCVKCCKPKDLRGKHLDGKTEVRSDCWPCARKTLFKRNRRKQGEVVGPAQGGGAGDAAATAVAPSTDSAAAPTTGVAAPTPSTFASGFKSAPVPAGSPFGNFGSPKPDDAKKSDEKKDDKAPAPAFGSGAFAAASFAPKKDDAAPTAPAPAFGKVGSAFGATAPAATPGKSAFGQPAQPPSVSPFPKTATAIDAAPKPDQKATEAKTEKADSSDAAKKTDQSGKGGMFSGAAFGGAATGVIGATGHSAFGQSGSGSAFQGQSAPATTSDSGTQSNTFGVKPPSGAAAFAQASSAPKAEGFNSPFTANEASKSGAPAAAFKSDFSKALAIDPSKNVPVDADTTEEGQEEGQALEETYTAGVVEFQQSTAPRLSSFDEETNVITFFPGTPQESTGNAPGYQRHMWSQSGQYCAVVFGDGSQLYEKQANGGMESIQLFDNVVLGFMTDNVLALWEHGDGTSTVITFVDFKGSVVLKSVNVTMGTVETGVAVASGVFLKAEDGWYSLQYSDDNTIDWAFMFEPDAELFSLEGLSILAVEENDANKMMLTVTNSDKPFQPCELPAAFVQAIDVNSNSWFQDAGCQLDFVCFKPCGGMVPFAVTCTELIERNFWELIKDCPGIAHSAPASAAVTPPQAPMHSPGKGLLPMPTQAPAQPAQQPEHQPQETASSTSSPTVPTAFLQPGFVKKVEEPAASAPAPAPQEEPAAATSSTPAASAPAPAAQPPKANGSAFGNANAFGGKSAFGGTAVAPGKSAFGAPSAGPAAAPAFGAANAFGQPQGGAAGFSTAFANKSAPTATPSTFGSAFPKAVSPIPQTAMSAPSPAAATVASTTVTAATATPVPESVEQGSNLSTGKPSEANVRELIEQDEAGELAAVPDQMSKDDDDDDAEAEAEVVKVDAAALARAKEREEEQALREAALQIELEATRAKLEAAEKQTILAREEAAEWRAKADSVMADLQATSSKMSKQIEDLMAELRVTKEKYQTHDAQTETVEKWEDFEEIKRGMREMATELAEFSAATTAEAGAPMQHIISRARMTINKRPFVAPAVPQRKPNEAPPSIAARAIGTR